MIQIRFYRHGFGVFNMRPEDEGGQAGALALRDSLGGMQQHSSSSLPSPMRQDPVAMYFIGRDIWHSTY